MERTETVERQNQSIKIEMNLDRETYDNPRFSYNTDKNGHNYFSVHQFSSWSNSCMTESFGIVPLSTADSEQLSGRLFSLR